MDYGYQLLRHVVQQVFGNLGAAARITILPILLAYVLCGVLLYMLVGSVLFELAQQGQGQFGAPTPNPFESDAQAAAFAGRFFLGVVVCIPIFLIFYSWAAVGWHRYVLLEEHASGVAGAWNGKRIQSYIGAILRVALVMMALGFAASVVFGIILAVLPSPGVVLFLTVGMVIGFTWVFTRLGLVLPSAALGTYMKMGDSWAATQPVSGAILLPIIVIPLAFLIINTITGLLGILGVILYLGVAWIQVLVNLALLTTLYGNLIEGRQLN